MQKSGNNQAQQSIDFKGQKDNQFFKLSSNIMQPNMENYILDKKDEQELWGTNQETSYFDKYLKILYQPEQKSKFIVDLLRKKSNLKPIHTNPLELFRKNEKINEKNASELYDKIKAHPQILGFTLSSNVKDSPELDKVFIKLIQKSAQIFLSNRKMCSKILRRYIQQSSIIKKCYFSKDQITFEPKMEIIRPFFKSNLTQINEEGTQFLILLEKIGDYYYSELNSCILALSEILNYDNMPKMDGFRKIFTDKDNEQSLLRTVWYFYTQTCDHVLEGSQLYNQYFKKDTKFLIDKIFARKIKLLIHLIKLLYQILEVKQSEGKGDNFIMRAFNTNNNNIYFEMIEKLDGHIQKFEKIDMPTVVTSEIFSKLITQLLLAIFPFQQFYKKSMSETFKYLDQIKSEALQPLKILLGKQNQMNQQHTRQKSRGIVKKLTEFIMKGLWNVNTYQWKKWIGIFLETCQKSLDKNSKELTNFIISTCKTIIKEEDSIFWKSQPKIFYIENIKTLIKNTTQGQNSITLKQILPLLSKSISRINFADDFNHLQQLIGMKTIRQIFENVRNHLHIYQQYRQNDNQRIIFQNENKEQQSIEQEIKFICKVIMTNISNLAQLQRQICEIEEDHSNGLNLMIELVEFMQAIHPQNQSYIKCLRYIIKTIDRLFVCEQTRDCIRLALAFHQNQKKKHSKSLKNILEICSKNQSDSQLGRQSKKLQLVVSEHLNHIIKISNSLQQYFPSQNDELYRRISSRKDKYVDIGQKLKYLDHGISISWFYYLALSLEKESLLSIDIDSIRLLILKLRAKNDTSHEYKNLESIVEILNNSHVENIIIDYLKPIIKGQMDKNKYNKETTMLGVTNLKYQSFVGSNMPSDIIRYSEKYKNKAYLLKKTNKLKQKEKIQVYRKLSAILMMIQTLLKLMLEGDYPLLIKLKLRTFIIQNLLGPTPYQYNIKYITKIVSNKVDNNKQKSLWQKLGLQKNKNQYINTEIQGSITLLHSIATFLDYQNRYDIEIYNHPSRTFNLKGIFVMKNRLINNQERLIEDIWFKSRQNIFSQHHKQSQSMGITTVLKILEYVIMLGYGKQLYKSIAHRNYLISQYNTSASASQNLTNYINNLIKILRRQDVTMYQQEHILSFLSLCIQDNHFQKYIINNFHLLKESLQYISKNKSTFSNNGVYLMTNLLYLINLILEKTHSNMNLRSIATCLSDPIKFAQNLFKSSQRSLKQLYNIKFNQLQDDYSRLYKDNKIKQVISSRLSLLLFLNIASYFICGQIEIVSKMMSKIVLQKFQTIIAILPTFQQNDFKYQHFTHLYYSNFIKNVQYKDISYLRLDNFIDTCFLLHSPFSIINNFKYLPFEIYQKQIQSVQNAKNLTIEVKMCNLQNGLRHTNQSLIQFYYMFLLGLMNRQKYGYLFAQLAVEKSRYTNIESINQRNNEKISQNKCIESLFFMKERVSNMLSFDNLSQNTNNLHQLLINILTRIQHQIWRQQYLEQSQTHATKYRDIALLTITQIISIFAKQLSLKDISVVQSQCSKMINKFNTYFITHSIIFSTNALVSTLNQLLNINYELLERNILYTKKYPKELHEICLKNNNNFFRSLIKQARVNFQQNITFNKHICLLNFYINFINIEINHVERMESTHKQSQLKGYLNHTQRQLLQDKIEKMLKYNINIMKNIQTFQNQQYIIRLLQMFNKIFYLQHLTKHYGVSPIFTHSFLVKLLQSIQQYYSKAKNERFYMSKPSIINAFLAQVYLYSEQQITKYIFRIMTTNTNLNLLMISKMNNMKTLSDIEELKSTISLFVSLGKDENWQNIQYRSILNAFFMKIQQVTLTIEENKITLPTEFQKLLSQSFIYENRQQISRNIKSKISIHQIIVLMRFYSFSKNYILFMMISLRNSHLVAQFCDKTFHSSQLDDYTLQRLKDSIINLVHFMNRFLQLLKPQYLNEVIRINRNICSDGQYIQKLSFYPLFFDNYDDSQDFISDILDTLSLVYRLIQTLDSIWQRNQWKSTIQWKKGRKQLFSQFYKIIMKYQKTTKNLLDENSSSIIQNIKNDVTEYLSHLSI